MNMKHDKGSMLYQLKLTHNFDDEPTAKDMDKEARFREVAQVTSRRLDAVKVHNCMHCP